VQPSLRNPPHTNTSTPYHSSNAHRHLSLAQIFSQWTMNAWEYRSLQDPHKWYSFLRERSPNYVYTGWVTSWPEHKKWGERIHQKREMKAVPPASSLFYIYKKQSGNGSFPTKYRHPTLLFRKQRGFQRDRELYNFTRGWGWLRLLDWIKYTCPTLGGIVVSLLQAFLANG